MFDFIQFTSIHHKFLKGFGLCLPFRCILRSEVCRSYSLTRSATERAFLRLSLNELLVLTSTLSWNSQNKQTNILIQNIKNDARREKRMWIVCFLKRKNVNCWHSKWGKKSYVLTRMKKQSELFVGVPVIKKPAAFHGFHHINTHCAGFMAKAWIPKMHCALFK